MLRSCARQSQEIRRFVSSCLPPEQGRWDTLRAIEVTPISQAFFAQFSPGISPGSYRADLDSDSTSTTYSHLSAAIRAYADEFLAIVARYTPLAGVLAEQFDKANCIAASALDRPR